MLSSKLPLTFSFGALLGNHYYFHRHRVNIALGIEQMPEVQTIHNDPPTFTVNSNYEKRIEKMIHDIERCTSQLAVQPLFEDYQYNKEYMLQDQFPLAHKTQGTRTYDMGETQIVGNFQNGSMSGPFELVSKDEDLVVKGELKGDKLSGPTVAYSKGCKMEIDTKTRSYVLTDQVENKVYVQRMPGNISLTKFYNKDGRKIYSEYKDANGAGTREVFEEDGSKLTVEMRNGQGDERSMYVDKYGDAVYKGSFKNGEISKNWYCYSEIALILGIGLLSTYLPRSPKRAFSKLGGTFWWRSRSNTNLRKGI